MKCKGFSYLWSLFFYLTMYFVCNNIIFSVFLRTYKIAWQGTQKCCQSKFPGWEMHYRLFSSRVPSRRMRGGRGSLVVWSFRGIENTTRIARKSTRCVHELSPLTSKCFKHFVVIKCVVPAFPASIFCCIFFLMESGYNFLRRSG